MHTQTKQSQTEITPKYALEILKQGNWRFEQNVKSQRDLKAQVKDTQEGQYPFAAILSCIDSRVPAELVFDQGIGDIFSVRVAGNIVNEDILGSLEYSCKVAGSKIIVVLGHSKCGAVTAACNNVKMGNITSLLQKIKVPKEIIDNNEIDQQSIELVSIENVKSSVERIRNESPILSEMENSQEIKIIGAMYDVSKGRITFYE